MATHERRDIDERDIDLLLAALTDRQIAGTFGWSEEEVAHLRLSRREALQKSDIERGRKTQADLSED